MRALLSFPPSGTRIRGSGLPDLTLGEGFFCCPQRRAALTGTGPRCDDPRAVPGRGARARPEGDDFDNAIVET